MSGKSISGSVFRRNLLPPAVRVACDGPKLMAMPGDSREEQIVASFFAGIVARNGPDAAAGMRVVSSISRSVAVSVALFSVASMRTFPKIGTEARGEMMGTPVARASDRTLRSIEIVGFISIPFLLIFWLGVR
jgi:hypothetical protein